MGSFYSHCLVRQECLSFFRAKLHVGINNCSITLSKTVSCWWQNTCKKELKRAEDREFKLCWITHVTSLCHLGLWSTHASWLWTAKAKRGAILPTHGGSVKYQVGRVQGQNELLCQELKSPPGTELGNCSLITGCQMLELSPTLPDQTLTQR